jgi:hypothetical protein
MEWRGAVSPAGIATVIFRPLDPGRGFWKETPTPLFARRRMQCPPIPIDLTRIYAVDLAQPLFEPAFSRAGLSLNQCERCCSNARVKPLRPDISAGPSGSQDTCFRPYFP